MFSLVFIIGNTEKLQVLFFYNFMGCDSDDGWIMFNPK